jgi:hypothetical protein
MQHLKIEANGPSFQVAWTGTAAFERTAGAESFAKTKRSKQILF